MSFIEVLQTQSKEDAQKALFDMLNTKAMDALSEMQLDEYNATGTVGEHKFKIVTDDVYDEKQVQKQNPHLSAKHVKAVVAHTESDEFLNDNRAATTQHGMKVSSNSDGYHGDVSDAKEKLIQKAKERKEKKSLTKESKELSEMQIDELSKDTLKSYVKKSGTDIMGKGMKIGHGTAREKDTSDIEDKVNKRLRGVSKAVDKIAESE